MISLRKRFSLFSTFSVTNKDCWFSSVGGGKVCGQLETSTLSDLLMIVLGSGKNPRSFLYYPKLIVLSNRIIEHNFRRSRVLNLSSKSHNCTIHCLPSPHASLLKQKKDSKNIPP